MVAQALREKAKAGREARVAAALPAGERLQFAVQGVVKAPTWVFASTLLGLLFGVVPGLILVVVYTKMTKHYFLAVTGTAVILLKIFKPHDIVAAYPLGTVPISRVKPGGLKTTLYLVLPGREKPVRFVVALMETSELDALVALSPLASSAAG